MQGREYKLIVFCSQRIFYVFRQLEHEKYLSLMIYLCA